MSIRKYVGLCSCVLLVILAACSSIKTPDNNSHEDEKTRLNIMAISGWEDPMTSLVKVYEKHNSNVEITLEFYAFDSLFENIEVKLGSESDDYDVVAIDGPMVSNYSVKNYLEPLDDYVSKDITSNWVDASVDAGSYDGKLMAAPLNSSSQVLYFNKQLFEKYGVTEPSSDLEKRWTWEETMDVARTLTVDENGDGTPDIFGFSFDQVNRIYQLLPLVQSQNGPSIIGDDLEIVGFFDSQEMIEAGQFYYKMFNEWKISPDVTPSTSFERFHAGDVAMFLGGPHFDPRITDIEYGVAPHPYFKDGVPVTPTGSWHIGIPKFSNNKEAAAEFIEFLTTGEGSQLWYDEKKDIPSTISVLEDIQSNVKKDSAIGISAYEVQETAIPRPITPGFAELQSTFDEVFSNIKNGQDPETAINAGINKLKPLLEKYK